MERSKQHQIDTSAGKIFQNVIPNEWVIRDQQQTDYGIDYEIEVFQNNNSTGIIFKVQLKGTENLKILEDQETISHSFSKDNINYYINEVHIPLIIVVVDVVNSKIYWHNPQIDKNIREFYNSISSSSQQSMTVHLSVHNSLPNDIYKLILEFTKSMYFISTRFLSISDDYNFSKIIDSIENHTDAIKEIQNKADILKLSEIEKHFKQREYFSAKKLIASILNSNESSVQAKYNAMIFYDNIGVVEPYYDGKTKEESLEIQLMNSQKLKEISKNEDHILRLYSLASLLVSQLHILTRDEYVYYTNWILNKDANDYLWLQSVYKQRVKYTKQINLKYFQLKRLLSIALDKEYFVLIPEILKRLSQPMSIYLQRLRNEKLFEAEERIVKDIFFWGVLGIEICKKLYSDHEVVGLAVSLLFLADIFNQQDFEKKKELIFKNLENISDSTKEKILDEINTLKQTVEENNSDIDEIQEDIDIYKTMANTFGIDLSDDTDEISRIVNIGIKDLNPGRILQNCFHLFVMTSGTGAIGEWLKLPTAGMKDLMCTKHLYRMRAISLDELYTTFKTEYCDKCNDCEKHSKDWQWTRSWQLEQNEIYKEYMK